MSATAGSRFAAVRKRAADDRAGGLVDAGALGAREELVPGAVERALPVGEEREGAGDGEQLADRVGGQHGPHGGGDAGREPHDVGGGGLAQGAGRGGQRGGGVGVAALGGTLEQQRALGEHQLGVDAGGHLDLGVVDPRAVGVAPAVDLEAPGTLGVRGDGGAPPVGLGGHLGHALRRASRAGGVDEDDLGAVGVVALAEDQRGDLEGLTDGGLGRIRTSFDLRRDIQDRYASNHAREPTQVRRAPTRPGQPAGSHGTGPDRPSLSGLNRRPMG